MPHGFRSSFRDWAAELTNHPREVVEAALAHVVGNQTEAAYARSDLFERPPPADGRLGGLPRRRARANGRATPVEAGATRVQAFQSIRPGSELSGLVSRSSTGAWRGGSAA